MGEVRYNSLARANPERAEKLFGAAVENAKLRYDYLVDLAKND
jgi:pyruvate-ferredoxin/flavodoxin oxidoreductase